MSADETQQLKPTRASFIRALPLSMGVDEVIERGREIGITIQPADVHAARYYMRQEADAQLSAVPTKVARVIRPLAFQSADAQAAPQTDAPPEMSAQPQRQSRARKGRTQTPQVRRPALSVAAVEDDLRSIVLRLGTDRVRAMIESIEESTLRRVLDQRKPTQTR
jgi:hypothetical protein